MRKWIYRIIPIGVLGFLLFLLCTMLFRFTNKLALCNVPLASYPDKVILSTIMEGNWQADFGKWLNDNFYSHTKFERLFRAYNYTFLNMTQQTKRKWLGMCLEQSGAVGTVTLHNKSCKCDFVSANSVGLPRQNWKLI